MRLLTATVTGQLRLGARTFKRPPLEDVGRLPALLAGLRATASRGGWGPSRDSLLRALRERATAASTSDGRLAQIASALERAPAVSELPPVPRSSPLPARPTSSAPPPRRPSSEPPATIVTDALEDTAAPPLWSTLRRHSELLRGDDHLRAVAEFLSAMADREASLPELAVLASRAWLAGGESAHARYFAKRAVADTSATDNVRLAALEILDTTPETKLSMLPPPVSATMPDERVDEPSSPREAPKGASLPPVTHASEAVTIPRMPVAMPTLSDLIPITFSGEFAAPPSTEPALPPPPPSSAEAIIVLPEELEDDLPPVLAPPVLAPPVLAPPVVAPPVLAPTAALEKPVKQARPEVIESLSLPPGATDELLPNGMPSTPLDVRVAHTQMARALARDYRLWYGTTLKTDPIAIDAMQRHLRRRFSEASDEQKVRVELLRHGALFAEIVARALGGQWVDVSDVEAGRWSMRVGSTSIVHPIGRVYRFYSQGHREADLVETYFELERASKV